MSEGKARRLKNPSKAKTTGNVSHPEIPPRLKRLVKRDAERNKIMIEGTNWKEIVRVKGKIV